MILKIEGELEVLMQSQKASGEQGIIWQLAVYSAATAYAEGDEYSSQAGPWSPAITTAAPARGQDLAVPADCRRVAVSNLALSLCPIFFVRS